MEKSVRILVILCIVAALISGAGVMAAGSDEQQSLDGQAASPGISIGIRLYDNQDRPLGGTKVSLMPGLVSGATNDAGIIVFRNAGVGVHEILIGDGEDAAGKQFSIVPAEDMEWLRTDGLDEFHVRQDIETITLDIAYNGSEVQFLRLHGGALFGRDDAAKYFEELYVVLIALIVGLIAASLVFFVLMKAAKKRNDILF